MSHQFRKEALECFGRDQIACPKTGRAEDFMMNAPSPVDERQLRELHLMLLPEVLQRPANKP